MTLTSVPTPQASRIASMRARDTRAGSKRSRIDARGDHRDPLHRRVVAVNDQLGDLIADCDHAVAARHHAVVKALEDVLLAVPFVPAGQERHAGAPRRVVGAPGGRAAMRMDHVATLLARDARKRHGVAQHGQRIVGGNLHRDDARAGCGDVGHQAAAARDHDRAMAAGNEDAHELHGTGVGGAGMQARHHDQHRQRRRVATSSVRLVRHEAGFGMGFGLIRLTCADGGRLRDHSQRPNRLRRAEGSAEGQVHPLDIARQQRGINGPHGFRNALRRKHIFRELPGARGHAPID